MNDRVLVDTSAFYALVSESDEFHDRASRIYIDLIDRRVGLFTSSYVLVECMALIQRRLGFPTLDRFVDMVRSLFTVMWLDASVHWSAWDLVKSRGGRRLSFVDCTTLVVAKQLNAKVFAFDEDFVREGLELI